MTISDSIMLAVHYSSGINRTTLQKALFFIDRLYRKDGEYQAHYYGPYSKIVDEQIQRLTGANFLKETMTTRINERMFSYEILKDAEPIIINLIEKNPKLSKTIRELLAYLQKNKFTTNQISAIAKVQFIQDYLHFKGLKEDTKAIAKQINWYIENIMPIPKCSSYALEIETIIKMNLSC